MKKVYVLKVKKKKLFMIPNGSKIRWGLVLFHNFYLNLFLISGTVIFSKVTASALSNSEIKYQSINLSESFKIYIICHTPWNTVQGGQILEMIQVCDYDIMIVLGELNTLI